MLLRPNDVWCATNDASNEGSVNEVRLYIRSRARVNIAVRRVSVCRITRVPYSLMETKNGGHSGQVKDVTSSAS